MRLDAWLQEEPPLLERLRVVERLCQAVDETNRLQKPLGALEPTRVELASDQECDLGAARRGAASAPYAAPERLEEAPPSAESDIYSAGAIAWEVLAGRPCADPPEHLATACREVARELADAVMACLERSPEWRPKDLSYVAELAKAGQASAGRAAPGRGAAKRPAPARAASSTRPAAPRERRAPRPPGSRGLYIALAGVLLAGAAALAFYTLGPFGRSGPTAATPTAAPARPDTLASTPVATPQSPTQAPAIAAPVPAVVATAAPVAAPRPTPAPTALAAARPTPQPPPTRPPAVAPAAPATAHAPSTSAGSTGGSTPAAALPRAPVVQTQSQPAAPATATTPPEVAPPQAAPPPAATAAPPREPVPAPPAATAAARPPATLTALSPLTARRPGKVLFDLHGTGLHDGLHAAIVPVKEAPRGISIVRQKCASDTLMNVLVDIDATAAPGAYAIVLDDDAGRQTKPLTFTVVR